MLQAPDRHGKPAAARFQGGAHVVIAATEPFVFKPTESFTVQAWFQTSSQENQVIAARPGAYSLGVKAGKLSAWVMADGVQYVEAVGSAIAADGQWHHAAVVCDRTAQTIAVFLDGKPDGPPLSIAAIGSSSSPAPLTIGAFGDAFPFDGSLSNVSIHRVALKPDAFSFGRDYAAEPAPKLAALSGSYTTAPCDWGQPVRLTALRSTAAANQGTITARVETSRDGFRNIAETRDVKLQSGAHTAQLVGFGPASRARVVLTLTTPPTAERSPVVSEVELTAEPVAR